MNLPFFLVLLLLLCSCGEGPEPVAPTPPAPAPSPVETPAPPEREQVEAPAPRKAPPATPEPEPEPMAKPKVVDVPEKELLPFGEIRTMLDKAIDGDSSTLTTCCDGADDRATVAVPFPQGHALLRIETMPYLIEGDGYKAARRNQDAAGRLSVLALYTRGITGKDKRSDGQSKIALPAGVVAKSITGNGKRFEATVTLDGKDLTVAGEPQALSNWGMATRLNFKAQTKTQLMDALTNYVTAPIRLNGALHVSVPGKFSAVYAPDASSLYVIGGLEITKISLGDETSVEKLPLALGERRQVNGQADGHPSKSWIAFGDGRGTLYHADANSGELLGTHETDGAMTIDVKWLPDGKRFVASHNGGMVSLVDIESGAVVSSHAREKPLSGEPRLCVSPSGAFIGGLEGPRRGSTRPQAWRWKPETPMEVEAVSPVREGMMLGAMAFLADDLVVLGWSDGRVDTYSLPAVTQKDVLVEGGTRHMPMDIQVLSEQLLVAGRGFCRLHARADGALVAELDRSMFSWHDAARLSPRQDSIAFPASGKVKVSPFPFK